MTKKELKPKVSEETIRKGHLPCDARGVDTLPCNLERDVAWESRPWDDRL